MKNGDIVKAALQQADGEIKQRPALVLKRTPSHDDFLLCGISTQLWTTVEGFDEVIDYNHADFDKSGLKAPSVIRLGYIATIPKEQVEGAIGSISEDLYQDLINRLSQFLQEKEDNE